MFFFFTVTKTERAGLVVSVARVERNLRSGRYAKRISTGAAVYMAATLEYIGEELLELSGDVAIQKNHKRIQPRHVKLAVENDAELKELLKGVTIADGGVRPNSNPVLLPKRPIVRPCSQ